MSDTNGIRIVDVRADTPAGEVGVMPGMRLLSINGFAIHDVVDLMFHAAEEELTLVCETEDGDCLEAEIEKHYDEDLGIEIEEFEVRKCNNDCIFCFVHQNPSGLRKSIYFKDGDYRMSFLHGNYITTTNLSEAEIARIIEQGLSPMYISVHATDENLRRRMLGVKKSPPILERMRRFADAGIRMHAQIVLCPGWNDGAELERSIHELASLGEMLLSVAVVPLGLTEYRDNLPDLKPVTPSFAREILEQGEALRAFANRGREEPLLYYSDEWYILAEAEWPDYSGIDVMHQLENGVGMLHEFYYGFDTMELPEKIDKPRRVAALTGLLGARAIQPVVEKLANIDGLEIVVVPLENTLFGRGVTVSGLLPGRDFQQGVRQAPDCDLYMIPINALRDEGDLFLDSLPLEALRQNYPVAVVDLDAESFCRAALGIEQDNPAWRANRKMLDWG